MPNIDGGSWKERHRTVHGEIDYGAVEEDQILLRAVGAESHSFIPGIVIATPGGGTASLDTASWNWLRPVLKDYVSLRDQSIYEGAKKHLKDVWYLSPNDMDLDELIEGCITLEEAKDTIDQKAYKLGLSTFES